MWHEEPNEKSNWTKGGDKKGRAKKGQKTKSPHEPKKQKGEG